MRGPNIEGNEMKIADNLKTLSYLVETNIEPYTNYSFYVEAFTIAGQAKRSESAMLKVRSDSASKNFSLSLLKLRQKLSRVSSSRKFL